MNSEVSFWGTKTQPKNITRRDGSVAKENDPNAEQIGETKAQRNAIRKVLPPAVEDYFIKFFRKEGMIRKFSDKEIKETAKVVGHSEAQEKKPSSEKSEEKQVWPKEEKLAFQGASIPDLRKMPIKDDFSKMKEGNKEAVLL